MRPSRYSVTRVPLTWPRVPSTSQPTGEGVAGRREDARRLLEQADDSARELHQPVVPLHGRLRLSAVGDVRLGLHLAAVAQHLGGLGPQQGANPAEAVVLPGQVAQASVGELAQEAGVDDHSLHPLHRPQPHLFGGLPQHARPPARVVDGRGVPPGQRDWHLGDDVGAVTGRGEGHHDVGVLRRQAQHHVGLLGGEQVRLTPEASRRRVQGSDLREHLGAAVADGCQLIVVRQAGDRRQEVTGAGAGTGPQADDRNPQPLHGRILSDKRTSLSIIPAARNRSQVGIARIAATPRPDSSGPAGTTIRHRHQRFRECDHRPGRWQSRHTPSCR